MPFFLLAYAGLIPFMNFEGDSRATVVPVRLLAWLHRAQIGVSWRH